MCGRMKNLYKLFIISSVIVHAHLDHFFFFLFEISSPASAVYLDKFLEDDGQVEAVGKHGAFKMAAVLSASFFFYFFFFLFLYTL